MEQALEGLASQLRGESGREAQAAAEEAIKGMSANPFSGLQQEIEEQASEYDAMSPLKAGFCCGAAKHHGRV